MQQFSNYNTYFYEIAYENYRVIKELCETIEKEGYFAEAEKLLNQSMNHSLDLYIQSLLVRFCIFCNRKDETSRQFMNNLVPTDVLSIGEDGELNAEVLTKVEKIVSAPPILLQLCGLYDFEKKEELSSQFFDGVLSILVAFASLDERKDKNALIYIEQFYDHTIRFVNIDQGKKNFPKRYLFKKMCSETIMPYDEIIIPNNNDENLQETTNVTKTDNEECAAKSEYEKGIQQEEVNQLDKLLDELNSLIGLESVKQQVNSLINVIKVRKLKEEYGMPLTVMSYHMVFTGNPGTGKTTVARLIAGIYKELGILKKGTFVETDRSGLVAGYVGQTAIKVNDIVKSALGGVLFIDEAYSLINENVSNDFGGEAIDALVKMMEDHREDLVVIVAGYKEEMQQFLKSNTGLISRFNTFIEFEDYTLEELVEILESLAAASMLELTADAKVKAEQVLKERNAVNDNEFGNARGVRNLFEQILVNQANRLVTYEMPTKEQVSTIEASDIGF